MNRTNPNKLISGKGLYASVFRDASRGDCTMNGVSARYANLYVFNELDLRRDAIRDGYIDFAELVEKGLEDQIVVIVNHHAGDRYDPVAVPYRAWQEGKWTMMGGNFLYTPDSRFPSKPVAIHDRIESR